MDKILENLPIILLGVGQLTQSIIIARHRREIEALWDLPKHLLDSLTKEDGHGKEE